MSADWIKVRIDLQRHPKVVRISSATGTDKFRVIGGLHAVWSVFDIYTTDGVLDGYTPASMDEAIGWPGFSQAMIDVEWMRFDGKKVLSMPEFTEHNGQSAKRRAEDQKRKRNKRRESENVPDPSAPDADKKRTGSGLEKEKEKDIREANASLVASPDDERLARWIFDRILQAVPGTKPPNFSKWANSVRLMRERDGYTHRQIAELFDWANRHSFWRTNVLSPDKLREKFAQLQAKKNEEATHATSQRAAGPSARNDQALREYFAQLDAEENAGHGVDRVIEPETSE